MPCGFLNLVTKWAIPSIFPTIFFACPLSISYFTLPAKQKKIILEAPKTPRAEELRELEMMPSNCILYADLAK
jgi:hypothetical protein